MNSLLVLALACATTLGSVSAFQYGAPPDRERNGLIGPVWLVTENGDHELRRTSIYDRKGNLTREEVNTGHGWQTKKTYEVSMSGPFAMCYEKLSSINSVPPSLALRPVSRSNCFEFYGIERVYKRTQEGEAILEERMRAGPELASRTLQVYDLRGRLIQSTYTNAMNLTIVTSLYMYEGTARQPSSLELQVDGRAVLKAWYEYKFDGQGNWISRKAIKSENTGGIFGWDLDCNRTIIYY
jgi:hypothetical protein